MEKSERAAWEKSVVILRDSNSWLTSQRDAWERVAAEHAGQIGNLNQAVVERDGQIGNLNQAVAERDGQIGNLNQAVTERDGRIAALASELHLVYNSTSWKITKPVRFFRRQLVNRPYNFMRRVIWPDVRQLWLNLSSVTRRRRTVSDQQLLREEGCHNRRDPHEENGPDHGLRWRILCSKTVVKYCW